MRRKVGLLILTLFWNASFAQNAEWKWLRIEAGIPNPVIMSGQATTVSQQRGKWTLKLIDRDRTGTEFVVRVHQSGDAVIADFEPPNTERVHLKIKGVRRETLTGANELFEEMIFAEAKSGNFLLISRFKRKSE